MDISNTLLIDNDAALRVEGIEDWIQTLIPIQDVNEENCYYTIRMIDSKTLAIFAITRIKPKV